MLDNINTPADLIGSGWSGVFTTPDELAEYAIANGFNPTVMVVEHAIVGLGGAELIIGPHTALREGGRLLYPYGELGKRHVGVTVISA